MSYTQNFGFFWAIFDEVRHPQSWRGHMRSFWKISLFHGASNMYTTCFPNPSNQVVHNCHLVLRGKKPPTQIGHHMWKILAPTFGQHLEPPPKIRNANLTKIPTCLEFEVFICYFGPHGSEHHSTPINTFHPCRLPPNGSQTPLEY